MQGLDKGTVLPFGNIRCTADIKAVADQMQETSSC